MKFSISETHAFDFKHSSPRTKFGTSEQEVNAEGIPLWSVLVVDFDPEDKFGSGETELKFTVASKTPLPVFARNQPVRFMGAVAAPYTMNGKSGIAYRATAVSAISPAPVPRAD